MGTRGGTVGRQRKGTSGISAERKRERETLLRKLLQLRHMGAFSTELPQPRKRVQRKVLLVWDAGTFSKVLSKRESKREVEKANGRARPSGNGDKGKEEPEK